jgi:siderophore synthetase component
MMEHDCREHVSQVLLPREQEMALDNVADCADGVYRWLSGERRPRGVKALMLVEDLGKALRRLEASGYEL